jgi:carbon monoxide dehydrogenase subunit G
MKLEQSFEVTAPLERVWEALIDVERVAPCLPGASVTGRNEDGSYTGEFKVKIGPTSAAYTGKLHMETVDAEAHSATMQASGTDRRGQGGAKATIVSSVAAAAEGRTRVEVSTDYHITGRLARFGRGGMIEEISNRLLGDFATNLQAMVGGGGPAPEAPEPAAQAGEEPASVARAGEEPASAVRAGEEPASVARAGEEPASGAPAAEAPPTAAVAEEALEHEAPAEAPDAAFEGVTPVAPAAETGDPEAPSFSGAGAASGGTGAPAAAASSGSAFPPPPTAAPESEPISALSLIGSVALKRAKENPAPLAALVIGFLIALRVLRRRS